MTARPANDNYRGGHPALKSLIKVDAEGALAVLSQIRGASPLAYVDTDLAPTTGDDAEPQSIADDPVTFDDLVEATQDGPDEVAMEMLHDDRPTERDLLSAIGWRELPFAGRLHREPIGWAMRAPARQAGHAFGWARSDGSRLLSVPEPGQVRRLSGLRYYTRPEARRGSAGGMLVSFGVDRKGKPKRPQFVANKPRGGKVPHRTSAAITAYLQSKGAYPSPLAAASHQRPMSGRDALMQMYTPLDGVEAARAMLKELGVDGSVPFAALPMGTRHAKAVTAEGARFIAGIVGSKETARAPSPAWQEPAAPLGTVLDEVAARGTLQSIGLRLGYRGGYADRAGKRALVAEGRRLVAANSNEKAAEAA